MTDIRPRRKRFGSIIAATAAMTGGAVAASWAFNYLLLFADGLSAFARSAITATVVPIVLAAPLAAFGLWQREKVRRMRRAGAVAAGRDPATGCIGQQVLSAVVDERRKRTPPSGGPASGAFLLLEMSGMRRINARFGPEWTTSALALVADTIGRSVRAGDTVGRLETGEFGIFLPYASEEDAKQVGKRIVEAMAAVYFAPEGIENAIDARVAGIVFDHQIEFAEMVRHAARQLADMPAGERAAAIRLETSATATRASNAAAPQRRPTSR